MFRKITINCDLGEGLDDIDAVVMPYLDLANIACGEHAGTAETMQRTVLLAQQHGVSIGAHPSYPDRENFGRKSLNLPNAELKNSTQQQVQQLIDITLDLGTKVDYIKPHGALYNDALNKPAILEALLHVAAGFDLALMLQALPQTQREVVEKQAQQQGVCLIHEAFADRAYTQDGRLVSRQQAHAVHSSISQVTEQVQSLIQHGGFYCENGEWLDIDANTICVHSDSPNALEIIQAIRQICPSH